MNNEAFPTAGDRTAWQAEIDALRVREKAHTHEGDAIAAARRRLPMVEVDASLPLTGEHGPVTLLDTFEAQCEGCTFFNGQVRELADLHARDATYATFCQGPYEESVRYRDFMGWNMPWYSAQESAEALLAGRRVNRFYLVCYLRD